MIVRPSKLSFIQMKKLPTKRLLAYKSVLNKFNAYADSKEMQKYQDIYTDVLEVLGKREHVERQTM